MTLLLRRLGLYLLLSVPAMACWGVTWFPLGPYGGDARSIAADPSDPHHLYLGTTNGWLYESHDTGNSWARVSRLGKRDDLVLDHVLVDPKDGRHLIVGAWKIGLSDGGVYISHDGGKNWYEQAQMRGQSVLAMAQAPTDPNLIVAGTLVGVYRSRDAGVHWTLISPEGSKELHEVESLAIDPTDPNIIYAGTWHLPWKTVDGGENWVNIKNGIIDDSDVFSIIVDPAKPSVVYASACSGIYKSTDAADQFHKIQGIPSTARRTRKLLQDPTDSETVYAGTTEGLYKTADGGRTFQRMTEPNLIINDVYVDPSNPARVLLATDRAGVLSSEDGAVTFHAANQGFSARQVSSFAANTVTGPTLYVGVVNDKETGGVFQSTDGGVRWEQQSSGLHGSDVYSLVATQAGTLLAGTGHGVYRLQEEGWAESSALVTPAAASPEQQAPAKKPSKKTISPQGAKGKKSVQRPTRRTSTHARFRPMAFVLPKHTSKKAAPSKHPKNNLAARKPLPKAATPATEAVQPSRLDAVIYDFAATDGMVYAGTSRGLLRSAVDGRAWENVDTLQMPEVRFVAAHGQAVLAAELKSFALSADGGTTWSPIALPSDLTQIRAVGLDERNNLWVGGREGVFFSPDGGGTWKTLKNLYVHQVDGIYFDAAEHRVLVTSSASTFAFAVHLPDMKVSYWDSGWNLRFVRPVGDHLIGATLYDGMVLQPQMVDSQAGK